MITSLRQQVWNKRAQRKRFLAAEKKGEPLYGAYYFKQSERVVYGMCSVLLVLFFSFFFYQSLFAAPFLSPLGVVVYQRMERQKGEKRKRRLEEEFRDCMVSVTANLRAGYSVENAFLECESDMRALYGSKGVMMAELKRIRRGLHNNIPLERMLAEFGKRSSSDCIMEFSEVFAIARSSGGSLPEVMRASAELIGGKVALEQEISVIISGRMFEQRIMSAVPFLLVAYIEITNSGFFAVLYHNAFGIAVMTGCLGIYITAVLLAEKISRV